MGNDDLLIGLGEAAQLAGVKRKTIQDWEQKGWLLAAVELAPRTIGRPGKLYRAEDVRQLAIKRGRSVQPIHSNKTKVS